MIILTLDFEGSLKNGIREIGAVTSSDHHILNVEEEVINENNKCTQILMKILKDPPQLFASHNVQTEKNLLKKYMPYSNESSNSKNIQWGPWLDTMEVYKTLYPQINNYDLIHLTELFIKNESADFGMKHCNKKKNSHHNALFDAICTFLLLERVMRKIDVRQFIR